MPRLFEAFLNYIEITPAEVIGAQILFYIAPLVIFSVLIWGFLQLWLDRRQGQFAGRTKWHLLHVNVPQEAIQTPKGMENFFRTIAGAKSSITWKEKWFDGKFNPWYSFEIVSIGGRISYYIRAQGKVRDLVEAAFYAQYPEAQITEVEDYAGMIPTEYPNDTWLLFGSEFKLSKPSFMPIRTWVDFEHVGESDQRFKDPLLSILESLGGMREGENFFIQILAMTPAEQDWTDAGEDYINEMYGKGGKSAKKGFFKGLFGWIVPGLLEQTVGLAIPGEESAPEQNNFSAFMITPKEKDKMDAVNRKISKYGYLAKIRFVYMAKHEVARKGTMASTAKGLFGQFENPGLNKFGLHVKATPQDDYPWLEWQMPGRQTRLAKRYQSRSLGQGATPSILNLEELATLWHFPAADARTPVLTAVPAKRAEAPIELTLAGEGESILPTRPLEAMSTIEQKSNLPDKKPLVTPSPSSKPTPGADDAFEQQAVPVQPDEHMPQPGMPAPLPPGLDIAEHESTGSPPDNLPL